jgi:hypothetical protein
MGRKSAAWAVCALVAASLVVAVPLPVQALQCGVWRWPVKTLSDNAASKVDYAPRATSVKHLRTLTAPSSLSSDTPRIKPVEFRTYKVRAQLVGAVVEDDHDIHLAIAVPGARKKTMIAEFPHRLCNGVRTSHKRAAMKRARNAFTNACGSVGTSWVDLKGKAILSGVGFWDEIHGQTGVAPNGIEIHPVLRFTGTCSRA